MCGYGASMLRRRVEFRCYNLYYASTRAHHFTTSGLIVYRTQLQIPRCNATPSSNHPTAHCRVRHQYRLVPSLEAAHTRPICCQLESTGCRCHSATVGYSDIEPGWPVHHSAAAERRMTNQPTVVQVSLQVRRIESPPLCCIFCASAHGR